MKNDIKQQIIGKVNQTSKLKLTRADFCTRGRVLSIGMEPNALKQKIHRCSKRHKAVTMLDPMAASLSTPNTLMLVILLYTSPT